MLYNHVTGLSVLLSENVLSVRGREYEPRFAPKQSVLVFCSAVKSISFRLNSADSVCVCVCAVTSFPGPLTNEDADFIV
jgi:hypothetical protein